MPNIRLDEFQYSPDYQKESSWVEQPFVLKFSGSTIAKKPFSQLRIANFGNTLNRVDLDQIVTLIRPWFTSRRFHIVW